MTTSFLHFHFIFDLHNADTTCESSFQLSTIHVVCLVLSLMLNNKYKTWQILLGFRIFKVFTICSFLSTITDELLVRMRKTSSMSLNQEKERVKNIFIKRLIMTVCYCRFTQKKDINTRNHCSVKLEFFMKLNSAFFFLVTVHAHSEVSRYHHQVLMCDVNALKYFSSTHIFSPFP